MRTRLRNPGRRVSAADNGDGHDLNRTLRLSLRRVPQPRAAPRWAFWASLVNYGA